MIASHIHDLMKEQFNLRYRDYLSEYESRCEPVAHWKDVLLMGKNGSFESQQCQYWI